MSRSRLRLDPSSLTAAIALAAVATLANAVWILLNSSDPSWDQAHYLSTALQYRDAFHLGGPGELLHSIDRADPLHGPLFTIALLPAIKAFGASNSSGLVVNVVVAPILYLAAGEIAYVLFRSGFARLLTIFLVATMPILVGLFHNVLQDFLLVTLTTLSLLLLLKSDGFRRRWITWAMALTMGLGTLTKVTFPLFVLGPLLVMLAELVYGRVKARRDRGDGADGLGPVLLNLAGAALIYLVVALAWYGPHYSATLEYIRSTTGGPLSLGAGPSDPYTFHAIASFTLSMISFNLSWVIVLIGLVAAFLARRRLRLLFRSPVDPAPLWKLAFLLAWALVPYLSVALAHNQDPRLMASAFPAFAVLAAGAVSAVEEPKRRLALTVVAVAILGYQTLTHVVDVTPGFMPDRASVSVSDYEASLTLNSEPINYEHLPESDYVEPIFDYIEAVASRQPGDPKAGKTVCLLESQPLINSNTLGFMSAARGDAYGFADISQGPGGAPDLEKALSACDFALYVRPAKTFLSGPNSRLVLVNEPYAANHMTPRMFRLFQGPSKSFPLLDNPPTKGEPEYLSSASGGWVRVLTRTPGAARAGAAG